MDNKLLTDVPVYDDDGIKYIRMKDVPPHLQGNLQVFVRGRQCPAITGEVNCLYLGDWAEFLAKLQP